YMPIGRRGGMTKLIIYHWTTPKLGGWKTILLEHSIQPIQQFRYTTGKNATDSHLYAIGE
ncbi:TPA: hypothetical protein EYO57_21915, partial [Candidatus Poribacteria bacterium]|nr:hypothetical protein [Candidatus Poribacteria bacterium]